MVDSKNTYWVGNGKFQAEQKLTEALMPFMGKADTVEGELVRASCKIYHDLYNNGFGNNWSGAWNLLDQSGLPLADELYQLADYRCGRVAYGHDPVLYAVVESIADKVTQYVISKNGSYTPNEVDMLDLSEPEDFDHQYDDFEDHPYGTDAEYDEYAEG